MGGTKPCRRTLWTLKLEGTVTPNTGNEGDNAVLCVSGK